jgi:hypothetical protein
LGAEDLEEISAAVALCVWGRDGALESGSLLLVERAFRCLETVDLHVRPGCHYLPERVGSGGLGCSAAIPYRALYWKGFYRMGPAGLWSG